MLKKYMVLLAPDANTEGQSSTPSNATADDAKEVSSTPKPEDAKIEDMTLEQVREHAISTVTSAEQKETEQASEVPAQEAVDKKNATVPTEEQVPFHDHPRWKEVMAENQQLRPVKQELDTLKPLAERTKNVDQFLQQNNIDQPAYEEALNLLALIRSNPRQAREKLAAAVQQLDLMTGAALPGDLQQAVDDLKITPEYAAEVAKSRLTAGQATAQVQRLQQQGVTQQSQAIDAVFGQWDQSKRALDPDFKPKASSIAPDGKWEMVNQLLIAARTRTPPRNQQEAVALVENAYAQVNGFAQQYVPKPAAKKNLSSQASLTTRPRFKSVGAAALAIARGEKVRPDQIDMD